MKIINACCIVVATCFVVIAYSQYQSQKAQWQLVEAQRQMTVVQAMSSGGRELGLFYMQKLFAFGWSHKDALDSLYHDPVQPKKHSKNTSEQKSREQEAQETEDWVKQFLQNDK